MQTHVSISTSRLSQASATSGVHSSPSRSRSVSLMMAKKAMNNSRDVP
ncbi:hypothetical protein FBZ94_107180 [Bradyrhizobium sacchari]|uniref:Uncharacterized protein n=1 Tax=Bradyrhizobium sacchari TaxID=1399419 RepID=A0A560K720_9BRAD|nr:hypothetical protein FBZ94_107180 [Bradyrhizobium sacchari]TWB79027.1 hypothetical protein FBZ95_103879 [Bradyrhizobium sacchari]